MKKIILLTLFGAVILYALSLLMPTHDDWAYSTAPFWGDVLPNLLPHKNFWRPWDVLFGWVLGWNVKLFPFLNHFCILIAHLGSAFLVYKIALRFKLSSLASHIVLFYFLLSPGILGTVLGIDSLNQAYATFWGVASLYFFLSFRGKIRVAGWIICALMAAFSKENGLVWLVIPPFLGLLDQPTPEYRKKGWLKYIGTGLLVFVLYFIARKCLETESMGLGGEDSPYHFSLKNKITDLLAYVSGSFLAVDFISILHKPSRNIGWAMLTLVANIPFLFLLAKNGYLQRKERHIWFLLLASFFAALPHLLTHFGPMHSYAPLPLNALLIGFIVNRIDAEKGLKRAFMLYIITACAVNVHHWYCTYKSAQTGIEMGRMVVDQTVNPEKALVITIMDEEPRYSSFCVPPREVYGRADVVRFLYAYQYPKEMIYIELPESQAESVPVLLEQYKELYDCAWINYKDSIQVINF